MCVCVVRELGRGRGGVEGGDMFWIRVPCVDIKIWRSPETMVESEKHAPSVRYIHDARMFEEEGEFNYSRVLVWRIGRWWGEEGNAGGLLRGGETGLKTERP